jgi:carbonic anhydrase/acetyltransferase-like protein (isoleucine patch superfamily)
VLDELVLVEEAEIADAIRELYAADGVVAEGAGAVAAAACWAAGRLRGPVVVVVSGGNIDGRRLADILAVAGRNPGAGRDHTYRGRTPRVHPDGLRRADGGAHRRRGVGPDSSIWFGAVLRGDHPDHGIRIGARVSIQDNCVLHVSARGPTLVGDDVTIGHGAVFESCEIRRGALVGMNAVILHGRRHRRGVAGRGAERGAGGMHVPPRTLVAGAPARIRKELDGESAEWVRHSASALRGAGRSYRADGRRGGIVSRRGRADVVVVGARRHRLRHRSGTRTRGLSVVVVERDSPGRRATWAAAGMLSPLGEAGTAGPFLELADESLRRYASFAQALREESGIDVEYRTNGKLHVAWTAPTNLSPPWPPNRRRSGSTCGCWTRRRPAAWSRPCRTACRRAAGGAGPPRQQPAAGAGPAGERHGRRCRFRTANPVRPW